MNKKNMKTLRRLTGNRAFSLVRLTTAVALISGAAAMAFVAASRGGDAASNTHGAAFSVRNTTVQDNGSTGVAVGEGSTAELTDCSLLRNSGSIHVFPQSNAGVQGSIST